MIQKTIFDLTGGYKSAEEVGLALGKKALTTVVSAGMGAASNYLGDLAGEALQGASKFANFAAQSGISMGTNYVTSVANSAVNSFYIGQDGLAFNTDGFTKSLYSADTISGALGAGITAGLNATTIGYNNQYVNGFNSQQIGNIKTFNSLMGGLATNTSSLLMGGNANFNLLSYKGVGMLEFSFGKDGIKSKIGMGGTNISMQNLVGAFGGATNLHKNSQINNIGYVKTTLDALRSQWGFGDEVAKDQLEEIIKRDTILKFDAEGSEVAQSITENGQKIIHLNSSQNNGFIDLGLTLQHEAYRDGIVSDAQSQFIETANAVAGHTKMAIAMANDKLYTKEMLNHISSDTNLQNDINAYMYAAYTGNTGLFAGYVGASYDSSADYWRVISKSDGTHSIEWDGSRNITIEYQDKDENGNWKKVGEDFFKDDTGSMAGSLGKLFGKERAEQLLGSNITNSDLYDTQTLKDVLGLSDADISKIQRSGKLPSNVTELQLYKLIGESLMKNNGITWNVSNENNSGFWDVSGLADSSIYGNKLTSFTLTDNNTMGYILFNELGTNQNINNGINSHTYFDRFVVTAELIRDERSFDAFYMRKTDSQGNSYDNQFDSRKSLESQNRGLDEIIYRKYDLNNNQLGESFITYAQTLDVYNTTQEKIDRNQPYYLFGEGWGQGNSVNSNFSLTINSLNTSDDWVMTLHNFYTIGNFNKNWVNSFSSNGLPGGAWGVHSSDYLTSDGCFIYTRPNRIEVQKRLNEWGLHSNHQIYGILR